MKFSCGKYLSKIEQKLEERERRLSEWHKWFAWHPVSVGKHDCRWLEYVERKRTAFVTIYIGS